MLPTSLTDLLAYLGAGSGIPHSYAGKDATDSSYSDDPRHPKLIDGILGSEQFNDSQWVGVRAGGGVGPSLVFDFRQPTSVKNVNIVSGVNHVSGGIQEPDQVTVSLSVNGKEFDSKLTFEPFDDSSDGLGAYQISRRFAHLQIAARAARFLRLDFVNDDEWSFLSGISCVSPFGRDSVSAQSKKSDHDSSMASSQRVAELVAHVKVGRPDEYRKIPDIWRQAIATGRRKVAADRGASMGSSPGIA